MRGCLRRGIRSVSGQADFIGRLGSLTSGLPVWVSRRTRGGIWSKSRESVSVEGSLPKGHLMAPVPKAQGASWKRAQKAYKSQRSGRTGEKECLLDVAGPQHPCSSQQLVAAAVVCTRPAHDQASPHSTCVGMRPPLLTEEWLTVDGF